MSRVIEDALKKNQAREPADEPIVDVSLEWLRELDDEVTIARQGLTELLTYQQRGEQLTAEELGNLIDPPDYSQEGVLDKLQESIQKAKQKLENKTRVFFDASVKKADKLVYRGDELAERIRNFDYERAEETVKITKANKLHISGDFGARMVSEGLEDTARVLGEILSLYARSWESLYDAVEKHHRKLIESAEAASEDEQQTPSFEQAINNAAGDIAKHTQQFWRRLEEYQDQELTGGNRIQIPTDKGYIKQTPDLRIRGSDREDPGSGQNIQTPRMQDIQGVIEASQACAQQVRDYERQARQIVERHHENLSRSQTLTQTLTPELVKRLKSSAMGDDQKAVPNSLVLKAYQKEQLATIRHVQRYLLGCAQAGLQYAEKSLKGYQ